MPVFKISATEEQVLTVTANPEAVYAFFSRPERMSRAMASVERCELLPENRVHWVLEEKVDKGIRFRGDYVVAFEGDGEGHVRWRSVEGNMRNDGDVWIAPLPGGGSEIRYRESVEPDLPITPLMARLITPLVARELRGEIQGFLDRVRAHLSTADQGPMAA
jgi:uncharacterized membrane protein